MGRADIFQKLYSFYFERYLGIQTTGNAAPTVTHAVHYTPLPYRIIQRVLAQMLLGPGDVFVDIGCGKGRVTCCACRHSVQRVVGIEVNQVLVEVAAANAEKVRGKKAPIELLALPAEEYDYSEATAIYLYNPFGRPIMDKVIARIDQSFKRRPRKLQIAYANCLHEQSFHQAGWLMKRKEWPASVFPGFACPISFWSAEL